MTRLCLFITSLLICTVLPAQQAGDFLFENYTTRDGLSHDRVMRVFKDSRNFMWFGTIAGLTRYDGYQFTVYKHVPDDTTTLSGNYIWGITEDRQQRLWITTDNGICLLDKEHKLFKRLSIAPPAGGTIAITSYSNVLCDTAGYCWLVFGNYLMKFAPNLMQAAYITIPSVEMVRDSKLFTDSKGRIWVLLRNALYRYDEQHNRFYYYLGKDDNHLQSNVLVTSIYCDSKQQVWATTFGQGLLRLNEQNGSFESVYMPAQFSMIGISESVTMNGESFYWCSIESMPGLSAWWPQHNNLKITGRFDDDGWGHNNSRVNDIFTDRDNNITWFATNRGVEKFDPAARRFQRFTLPDESRLQQHIAAAESIIQDKTDPKGNTYWITSWSKGLYKWERAENRFTLWSTKDGLKSTEVFNVAQAKDGNLWLGVFYGIQRFDPKTHRVFTPENNYFSTSYNRKVLALITDHTDNVWFHTSYEALFTYYPATGYVKKWSLKGVVPQKGPYLHTAIVEDTAHRIWVNYNNDIFIINPADSSVKLVNNDNREGPKLPGDVFSMTVAGNGDILVGCSNAVMAILDEKGEVKKIYTDTRNTGASKATKIVLDPMGYAWMATDFYLHRINIQTGARDYFSTRDGLFADEVNNALMVTAGGELFTGFEKGFTIYNTASPDYKAMRPLLAVTEINGFPACFTDSVMYASLSAGESFRLGFTDFNYSQLVKSSFVYRIDQLDTGWKPLPVNELSFLNIPAGNYTIRIKSRYGNGTWGPEMVHRLEVSGPFYNTTWFRFTALLLMIAIVYAVYRYKRNQQLRLQQIRDSIATDLHDDMGSTLSSIRIFSEVAKKQLKDDQPQTYSLLQRISDNAAALSENMQDIVWAIRTGHDSMEELVTRMREFALRLCDARNIEFTAQVPESFTNSKLNLQQRRNLYLIFKEAVNNAVKYAEPTQVKVFLSSKPGYLKMEVIDNGKGFELSAVKKGNGIGNIEKRAREIGGTAVIASSSAGTNITVTLLQGKQNWFKKIFQ